MERVCEGHAETQRWRILPPEGPKSPHNGWRRGTTPGIQLVADFNTPIPGGTGNFTSSGNVALVGTRAAFSASGASQQGGVYLADPGAEQVAITKIADDLLRAVSLPLHRESSLPHPGAVRLS